MKIPNEQFKADFERFKAWFYNYVLTYFPSCKLRHSYLKKVLGVKIGKGSFVHLGCYFNNINIEIGNNTVIGRNVDISGEVKIGDNCSITAYTIIQSITHDKNSPTFNGVHKPVKIGNHVWIGFRSIILPGAELPDGVIIGANSTVLEKSGGGGEYLPCTVYAGSPAREVSKRSKEALKYILNYRPKFN